MSEMECSVSPVEADALNNQTENETMTTASFTTITKTVSSEEILTESQLVQKSFTTKSENGQPSPEGCKENDEENTCNSQGTSMLDVDEINTSSSTNTMKRIKDVRFSLPDVLVNNQGIKAIHRSLSLEDNSEPIETTLQRKNISHQHGDVPSMNNLATFSEEYEFQKSKEEVFPCEDRNNVVVDQDGTDSFSEPSARFYKNREMENREFSYTTQWEREEFNETISTNLNINEHKNTNFLVDAENDRSNMYKGSNLVFQNEVLTPIISEIKDEFEISTREEIIPVEITSVLNESDKNVKNSDMDDKTKISMQAISKTDVVLIGVNLQKDVRSEEKVFKHQDTQTDLDVKCNEVSSKVERDDSSSTTTLPLSEVRIRTKKRSLPPIPARVSSSKFKANENIRNWFHRNDASHLSTLTLRGRYPDISYIDEPYYVTRTWQSDNATNLPYYPFFEEPAFRNANILETKPLLRKIYLPSRADFNRSSRSISAKRSYLESRHNEASSQRYQMQHSSLKKQSLTALNMSFHNQRYYKHILADSGVIMFMPEVEDAKDCWQRKCRSWLFIGILAALIVLSVVCIVVIMIVTT